MKRPCSRCGELCDRSPCAECSAEIERARHARQPRRDHPSFANRARWKNLSKRLRKMSPFCELCGSTDDLTVDHIIPVSEAPDLVYAVENCRIACRSCNSSRGDNVTDDERAEVLRRIADAKARRLRARPNLAEHPGGVCQVATPIRRRRWAENVSDTENHYQEGQ